MSGWKWLTGAVIFTLLSSCSVRPGPVEPGGSNNDPNLLVSGEIVRLNEPRSYQGEAVFREGAHAVVTLSHYVGVDGPADDSVTQRVEGITGFPIPFRIEGDPKRFFARPSFGYGSSSYYTVSATVYMGAGDELYIGDFVTDRLYEVDGPTSGMRIGVTGLERCGSPDGGGACAESERP